MLTGKILIFNEQKLNTNFAKRMFFNGVENLLKNTSKFSTILNKINKFLQSFLKLSFNENFDGN